MEMKKRQRLVAIFALGILIAAPTVWGCEQGDTQSCSMSACPMMDAKDSSDCQEPREPAEHNASVACCDTPRDQEPATIETLSGLDSRTTPIPHLAGHIETRPPARPPDTLFEVISSRQHELGRFTLFSSYLL